MQDAPFMSDEAATAYAAEQTREMQKDFVRSLTFAVVEDLVETDRHPEDGERRMASVFSVRATAPDGKRWVYFTTFRGPTRFERDGYLAPRPNERTSNKAAEDAAEKLLGRIEAAVTAGTMFGLKAQYWSETSPVYGSESWTHEDEVGLMDDEEREGGGW
jgi:hypothetical protein